MEGAITNISAPPLCHDSHDVTGFALLCLGGIIRNIKSIINTNTETVSLPSHKTIYWYEVSLGDSGNLGHNF